jgi:hypothetical protein
MAQHFPNFVIPAQWLFLLATPWLALSADSGPSGGGQASPPASFNVRDFGAKGDGKSDDARAIQATFDTAAKKTWSEQPPGSAYFISIPTVFFPAGKYVISETIDLKVNVQGEGTAILEQKSPEKDVFSSTFGWRLQVSGLTLVGGRHQLHLGNPNIDTGRITIDKCAFYNASGTAIRLRQGTNSTQVSVRDGVFLGCDQALEGAQAHGK